MARRRPNKGLLKEECKSVVWQYSWFLAVRALYSRGARQEVLRSVGTRGLLFFAKSSSMPNYRHGSDLTITPVVHLRKLKPRFQRMISLDRKAGGRSPRWTRAQLDNLHRRPPPQARSQRMIRTTQRFSEPVPPAPVRAHEAPSR